jgi:hypothetical protein
VSKEGDCMNIIGAIFIIVLFLGCITGIINSITEERLTRAKDRHSSIIEKQNELLLKQNNEIMKITVDLAQKYRRS